MRNEDPAPLFSPSGYDGGDLAAESSDRAVVGVGRGDSALTEEVVARPRAIAALGIECLIVVPLPRRRPGWVWP